MNQRIKVLIAEDDKNVHILYDEGLGDYLFEKRFVDNGRDALEIYQTWKPHVLVLDIMMPLMTGYSVLKTIRTELRDDSPTIIMATSLSDSNDIEDCARFGIQGYIVKPFKLGDIASRVLTAFKSHRSASAPCESGDMKASS